MSPEINQERKVASVKETAEALREHYDSIEMKPGEVHEIPPLHGTSNEMASCGKDSLRVYQHLRAAVKAGNELFYIIDTTTIIKPEGSTRPEFVENTVLARRDPNGDRSEIVSFINKGDRPVHIGRRYQSEIGLSPETSGDHFSIAQIEDGSIGIVDNGSRNGTELFLPRQTQIGEKYGFSEELRQATAIHADPVAKHEAWSVSSINVKSLAESAFSPAAR